MTGLALDAERLRGLLEAARALVTERELGPVLGRLLEVSRTLTGAGHGAVGIIDSDRGRYGELISAGVDPELRARLRELLASGPPERWPDGRRAQISALDHPLAQSVVGVPIVVDRQVWGALYLVDERPARFSAADEDLLTALADWAAVAIDNARVQEDSDHRRIELERSVAALEATFEIARAVGGETRMDRVLELIADRSRALVGASGVFILLPEGPDFVVAAIAGEIPAAMAGSVVPGPLSIARRVLREGRPVRIRVSEMPHVSREVLGALGLTPQAALIVPLVFRGSSVGVIEALDRLNGPEFLDEDEHRLQAAAASAATAVATAQTVERDRLHRSLQAAEEERRRWARELHDETLQALGGLRMTLSSARRLDDADALRGALDGAVEQLGRDIAELRALITELRPASLDQLGLEPALEALFERSRIAYGLPVAALVELSAAGRLHPEAETAIYRVVQESLNNAAQHAQASTISVEVLERGAEIGLCVADDGHGFDQSVPTAGFGVLGMRERIALAGGRLNIESSSKGTTVSAVLPVRRATDGRESESTPPGRAREKTRRPGDTELPTTR